MGERLHRLSSYAFSPGFDPLGTEDVDAVAPLDLSPSEELLDERLKAKGFEEELSSDFKPPVTHYTLPEFKGFEVEFLADQPGGFRRRDGTDDFTAAVAGVTVQKLHYIRLLLIEPLTVRVRTDDGYPMDTEVRDVRIPNPTSYIVQKLLARRDREERKRAKDVLYIHDTLQVFGEEEDMLRETWARITECVPRKWATRCSSAAAVLAGPAHRDVVGAARIATEAGRTMTADQIATVLRYGLSFLEE